MQPKPIRAVYNTSHETFPLLCSWQSVVNLRDSYTVKTKAYSYALLCIYVCPTSAHRGFRYGYRRCKDNTFTLKTTWFGRKSMILRFDLTLLNINMSKKSTLSCFFLLKSLYYQWLFVSLHRQFSPRLLTMLKSCEAFVVYTHLNMATLIRFTKRFESSENLVKLLESRGLQICDRNKAIQ